MNRPPQTLFEPGQRDSDWYLDSLLEYVHQTRLWVRAQPRTPARNAIESLLHSFMELAVAYYTAVATAATREQAATIDQKYAIQQAIDKLSEEWMRLAPTVQVAAFDEQSPFRLLSYMVAGAYRSLMLEQKCQITVIPHFGRHFNLVKFRYAPDVSLMSMPVFALQTPWEWSVIWHELAGLVIVQSDVAAWIDAFVAAEKGRWSIWTAWTKLDQAPPQVAVAAAVPVAAIVAEPLAVIDRRGWIEELVEDACSILTLGPVAYVVIHDVLAQRALNMDARKDGRHPPPNLRLEVAWQLLTLMAAAQGGALSADIKREHGRYENDAGAHKVAKWIWGGRTKIVRMVYDDWGNEDPDKNELLKVSTAVLRRSIQEKTPLSRAAQYLEGKQAEEVDTAWLTVANFAREIILGSRAILQQPDLGRDVLAQTRRSLQTLVDPVVDLLMPDVAQPSQAAKFIEEVIVGKSLNELITITFSSFDFGDALPLTEHNHGSGQSIVNIAVTIPDIHGQKHAFTVKYNHKHSGAVSIPAVLPEPCP